MKLSMIIALCFLSACTTIQTPPNAQKPPSDVTKPTPPVKPSPTQSFAWDAKPDGKKWSAHALSEVGKSTNLMQVIPSDYASFCPKYKSLTDEQKKVFWVNWLVELAKWESNHNPAAKMAECRKDRCVYGSCFQHPSLGFCMKGGHRLDEGVVVSRGLTQMSLASSIALGCDVKVPNDLHDPYKNISCSLRAMNRYLGQDKSLFDIDGDGKWGGCSKYWAVCRGTNDYTKRALAAIRKAVQATKGCY